MPNNNGTETRQSCPARDTPTVCMPAWIRWTIALLISATVFRTQTVLFLPELAMFGGPAPDGWFAPWLSDALIGLLAPIVVYVFWTRRGVRVWGLVLTYNALGAFDYANGLAAQWISPMPVEMASPATVYAGIGVFLGLQMMAFALLLQPSVIRHFNPRDGALP